MPVLSHLGKGLLCNTGAVVGLISIISAVDYSGALITASEVPFPLCLLVLVANGNVTLKKSLVCPKGIQ